MIKEYSEIVFIQDYTLDNEDRENFEKWLNNHDEDSLFKYLIQWDTNEDHTISNTKPWGNADNVSYHNEGNICYALSYNRGLGYASLTKIIED